MSDFNRTYAEGVVCRWAETKVGAPVASVELSAGDAYYYSTHTNMDAWIEVRVNLKENNPPFGILLDVDFAEAMVEIMDMVYGQCNPNLIGG